MNPIEPYEPISCAVHDRLEALAVQGRRLRLDFFDDEGDMQRVRTRILDVFASGDGEWLLVEDGRRIRLDRIVEFQPASPG